MSTHQTVNHIYLDNTLSHPLRCSGKFITILCSLLFSLLALFTLSTPSVAGQTLSKKGSQANYIDHISMDGSNGREFHTLTTLNDGRILVIGGTTDSGISNDARFYEPEESGENRPEWQMLPPMSVKRSHHTTTLLDDGSVLVVGGQNGDHQATNRVELFDPIDDSWRDVAPLNYARYNHTATRLDDGRILVIGGVNAPIKVEIYDPQSDQWVEAADLNVGRYGHRDVITPDGRLVVLGGYGISNNNAEVLQSVEVYDSMTDSWAEIADMLDPRTNHTATLLPNGLLIVVGGDRSATAETSALSSVELLDTTQNLQRAAWQQGARLDIAVWGHIAIALPQSSKYPNGALLISGGMMNNYSSADVQLYHPDIGTGGYWFSEIALKTSRYNHTAALLPNNQLFIFGGVEKDINNRNKLIELEETHDLSMYPSQGRWMPAGPINIPRYYHSATLLKDGRVLAVGGARAGPTAELYDPEFSQVGTWTLVEGMTSERYHHTATLLDDGRVIIIGGKDDHEGNLNSVEVFEPESGSWSVLPKLEYARYRHTTVLLNDGKLLVIGGRGGMHEVEIYDLDTERFKIGWIDGPTLNYPRDQHTATLLKDGRVLVVGGQRLNGTYLSQVEIYDPSHKPYGLWKEVVPLHQARASHSAILLDSGKVLVLGGVGHNDESLRSVELYDPENDQWQQLAPMNSARDYPTTSLLDDGTVLVVGSVGATTSAEVLDLSSAEQSTWSMVAPLNLSYARHTTTLLPDGQILALGSTHQTIVETFSSEQYADTIIPTIQVTKRNDANQDGIFTVNEQASLDIEDIHNNLTITFQLAITNTTPVDVTIMELNDTLNGYGHEYEKVHCSSLAGAMLKAGEHITCTFNMPLIGDDNLALRSTTQVVVRSENGQNGVNRDETFIETQDIAPLVQITQTNDANQDGSYGESEKASSPTEEINFRLDIFNSGLEEVYIEDIPELNPAILTGFPENCATLDRIPLSAGESISCVYTQNISAQDNRTIPNVTAVQVKDNDGNQSNISTTSHVMIEDQLPEIELVYPEVCMELLPTDTAAICNVAIKNTNEYENLTLRVIQPEMQIIPPEGPPIIKADMETNCQGPRPIHANKTFECNYSQKVDGVDGSRVNCIVSVIVEDDDGNQISIEGIFNRYVIGDDTPLCTTTTPDPISIPTSLKETAEPIHHAFYLPHVSR